LSSVRRYPSLPWAFIFADYREESWWYAIDFVGNGPRRAGAVYLVGDVDDKPLAIAVDLQNSLRSMFGTTRAYIWARHVASMRRTVRIGHVRDRGKALRRVLSVFLPSGRYDSNGTARIVNAVGVLAAIFTLLLLAFVVNRLLRDGLKSSL
jgi:hypothetical protein